MKTDPSKIGTFSNSGAWAVEYGPIFLCSSPYIFSGTSLELWHNIGYIITVRKLCDLYHKVKGWVLQSITSEGVVYVHNMFAPQQLHSCGANLILCMQCSEGTTLQMQGLVLKLVQCSLSEKGDNLEAGLEYITVLTDSHWCRECLWRTIHLWYRKLSGYSYHSSQFPMWFMWDIAQFVPLICMAAVVKAVMPSKVHWSQVQWKGSHTSMMAQIWTRTGLYKYLL